MLYKMIHFFTYRTIVCIRQNVNRTKLNKKFANKARSQHLNRPFRILNLITLWDQSHCAPPTDFLGTFCDRKTRKRTASFAIFSDFSLRQQWKGYRQLLHFCAAAPPSPECRLALCCNCVCGNRNMTFLYILDSCDYEECGNQRKNLTCPFWLTIVSLSRSRNPGL